MAVWRRWNTSAPLCQATANWLSCWSATSVRWMTVARRRLRQRMACFSVGFPSGSFALVVGPPFGAVADLVEGDEVKDVVQLSVAASGETMANDVTRGHLERSRAAVGGELVSRFEAADRAAATDDSGGQDGADPVKLEEQRPPDGHSGRPGARSSSSSALQLAREVPHGDATEA